MHAFRGWKLFIQEKGHSRFHHLAAIGAIMVSIWLDISTEDWLWIGLAILMVYVVEMINSALELLIDALHPGRNERIRDVKDRLAAVVLICAIFSIIVAFLVWSKYL